jgi:hypothetical protein
MIQKAISLRKKHRYKPNTILLLGGQFVVIFISCLVLGGYSRFGKTFFTIINRSDTAEKIECLIVINQDTIFYQRLEPHLTYHFSKKIPKGKHVMQIHSLSQGLVTVDTLRVRDQYHSESIYIDYQYLTEIDAIGKNITHYGHDYQKLAKHNLFQPVNRSFEIDQYHSHFFSFLWEVYY